MKESSQQSCKGGLASSRIAGNYDVQAHPKITPSARLLHEGHLLADLLCGSKRVVCIQGKAFIKQLLENCHPGILLLSYIYIIYYSSVGNTVMA